MSEEKSHLTGSPEVEGGLSTLTDMPKCLVIHNDDFNTFDYVIDALIEICGHSTIQAEQCALIIHNSGKCTVKTGSFREVQPMWAEIIARGLTSTIEEKVV
ncbi:MAG: ATP-dependent Clp protease adaptor protein ClpS [Granulosicoccus sp.]|jgi:ATP-dependent Clp protease adaptor protein ClpS